MKSFIIGAIPLAIFFYLVAFHAVLLITIFGVFAFAVISFLLGVSVREEFGDLRDKERTW